MREGLRGWEHKKTTAKSVGLFLYRYCTPCKDSVVDLDPDSALYLIAGSGFRDSKSNADPCGFGSAIIQILVFRARFFKYRSTTLPIKVRTTFSTHTVYDAQN
jgi:hypothetical protein